MEFFIILTLSQPYGGGVRQVTITRTVTPGSGVTRAGLLNWAVTQAGEGWQGANVLFFTAEPNTLPTALKAVKG